MTKDDRLLSWYDKLQCQYSFYLQNKNHSFLLLLLPCYLYPFSSHKRHYFTFLNPKENHLNIIQHFTTDFTVLSPVYLCQLCQIFPQRVGGFSIHKSPAICSVQTSVFFCINKVMLTSQWTKPSAFDDSTRMKLLSVDALLSSFLGRYLHARVIQHSTKWVMRRFRIDIIKAINLQRIQNTKH